MRTWAKAAMALVTLASISGAQAKPKAKAKAPGKDFWKVLVQPKANWWLASHSEEDDRPVASEDLQIETYDVRKIGDANVARLRFSTRHKDDQPESYNDGADDLPTQVAVTDKGLYLLRADMDDAAVTAALQKAPSRSSPPKAYKGTKKNHGRYLRIAELGIVCMGWKHLASDGECDERCEGEICISPTDGIVSLDGTYAPQDTYYLSSDYQADYSGADTLHFRKKVDDQHDER